MVVAPFAGAWIETAIRMHGMCTRVSPLRGRVDRNSSYLLACRVAPFAGAWIETRDMRGESLG